MLRILIVLLLLSTTALFGQTTLILNPVSGAGVSVPDPLFSLLLDEGSGNPSYSGTVESGTCSSLLNTTWVGAPTALDFNGTDSIIASCDTVLDALDTGTFTGCIAPRTFGEGGGGAGTGGGRIMQKENAVGVLSWRWYLLSSANEIRFTVVGTGGSSRTWGAAFSVGVGYQHVAIAFDCASVSAACEGQIWVDGSPLTTNETGSGTGSRIDDDAYIVRVGNENAQDRTFDGPMNRIAVRPGVLSDAQVAAIATSDDCGN